MRREEGSSKRITINIQKSGEGLRVNDARGPRVPEAEAAPAAPPRAPEPAPQIPIGKMDTQGRFVAGLKGLAPVFVPTSTAWFDAETVHQIERESLPEFFESGDQRGEIEYKQLRNAIMSFFFENPAAHLPVTSCLTRLGHDSGTVIRVHSFLEQWALINFPFDASGHNMTDATPLNHTFNFGRDRKLTSQTRLPRQPRGRSDDPRRPR